jgi:hypothetical protein
MSTQDIVALSVAAAALAIVVRFLWRTMTTRAGCAKGCGCAKSSSQGTADENRSLKRVPLVTIGKPVHGSEQTPVNQD